MYSKIVDVGPNNAWPLVLIWNRQRYLIRRTNIISLSITERVRQYKSIQKAAFQTSRVKVMQSKIPQLRAREQEI
jgi:hypothetical protein